MSVKKLDEVKKEEVKAATKTTRQVLIGPNEGPNFAMRKFTIEPGGSMPMHTNTVEHEQLVLGGQAIVVIDDKTFEVKKDDVVFIPAKTPHSYQTVGNEPFEFLCVVPNKEDIMEMLK
ncbi:MAG: cupin domain-containing protein [Bacteroidetes bacterium]|nr:cupin domain-containing protein [Bacteroidota bacterium]